MAKLTLKQKKFADEYIISGNATESYKRVYSNVKEDSTASAGASRMLRNVKVKSYIEERLAELNSEKIADQEEILQYLTSVMRGEHREETLIGMGQGFQETTYMDVGAKDRIKAAELLGKRYSMWIDKQTTEQRELISEQIKSTKLENKRREIELQNISDNDNRQVVFLNESNIED